MCIVQVVRVGDCCFGIRLRVACVIIGLVGLVSGAFGLLAFLPAFETTVWASAHAVFVISANALLLLGVAFNIEALLLAWIILVVFQIVSLFALMLVLAVISSDVAAFANHFHLDDRFPDVYNDRNYGDLANVFSVAALLAYLYALLYAYFWIVVNSYYRDLRDSCLINGTRVRRSPSNEDLIYVTKFQE